MKRFIVKEKTEREKGDEYLDRKKGSRSESANSLVVVIEQRADAL
jgi:hypothetical protein